MAQSMFNLDTIRKAKQSYKANPTTTPSTGSRVNPFQAMSQATSLVPTKTMTPTTAASAAQKMVAATTTPSRTEQTLGNISSAVNTPFTYDAESDPAYQAAVKAAQQNLAVNQKNTNAQLRATGQGKSSYSETVANQLANQTTENIANNILPQYAQQAYGRYQDNIANQGNLYGLQYQQDVTTPQNEAQLTGNYLPPEAKTAINNLLGLKTQAETKGITAGERSVLSTEADKLRSQLKSLGIDPSFYGADKTAAQASSNNPGIRTLAGQSQDLSAQAQALAKQEQEYNQGITNAQLTGVMPDGSKTTAEQQRQLTNLWTVAEQTGSIPDGLATMYGLPKGTETLAAKQFAQQLAISQQNADTSSGSLELSRDNAAWDQQTSIIDAEAKAQQAAAKTMTPQDYAKSYVNPIAKYKDGKITNKNDVIAAISMGAGSYTDAQLDQLFNQYQITDTDVKAYQKAYGLGE
ncbi:hypothetical protein BK125_04825 [Paenibacillus odorifer]|uniref:Uncharacterized protein n=1 Tax=Paenibacillus odorifer TaxID=189426 RepID=A0ABX3GUH3_9BACL|nr:hypothetical protein [Paenibacillus odorifer]OMC79607.1 hypothetical protein BK125_04825 [Paenibacillus odorifer]OMD34953.1 hypothetical protein BSO21_10070 [Paenibacillus odorifer]